MLPCHTGLVPTARLASVICMSLSCGFRNALAGFLVLLMAAMLSGCGSSCDGNSKAANYARSLSSERLRQLYQDMERYSKDERTPHEGWGTFRPEEIPDAFRDLKVVRIRPRDANIMIEGCFDEFLYLDFNGFDGKGPRTITLVYPTGPNYKHATEVLWQEQINAPASRF